MLSIPKYPEQYAQHFPTISYLLCCASQHHVWLVIIGRIVQVSLIIIVRNLSNDAGALLPTRGLPLLKHLVEFLFYWLPVFG